MTDKWNDLYLRTGLQDNSPNSRANGPGSPDILLAGISLVDPLMFTTPESYKQYVINRLQPDRTNQIYVRAKSSSTEGRKAGEVGLGISQPSLIVWPGSDTWQIVKTKGGNDRSRISVDSPGSIGVTTDPFIYTFSDDADQKNDNRRSVAAWISTPEHPIVGAPPKISSMPELVRYLIEHPNYATLNLDPVENAIGRVIRADAYAQGDVGCKVIFGIHAEGCKGFKVGISCPKPLPDGKYISISDTTIPTNEPITLSIDRDVPAGFDANIFFSYDQMNLRPETFLLTLVAYFNVEPPHPLYPYATTYEDLNVVNYQDYAPYRAILVGSVGFIKGSR